MSTTVVTPDNSKDAAIARSLAECTQLAAIETARQVNYYDWEFSTWVANIQMGAPKTTPPPTVPFGWETFVIQPPDESAGFYDCRPSTTTLACAPLPIPPGLLDPAAPVPQILVGRLLWYDITTGARWFQCGGSDGKGDAFPVSATAPIPTPPMVKSADGFPGPFYKLGSGAGYWYTDKAPAFPATPAPAAS